MENIYKSRYFSKSMKKTGLSDDLLREAVMEMKQGLVDANLGGNLYKKRIPLAGRGKRGSIRTIIAYRKGSHWYFLYGFPKSSKANISKLELEALRAIADDLLKLTRKEIGILVSNLELSEVCDDKQKI